ncbi:MAG: ATP-binding protein [Candidatus Aminicenantes bacterium]|nr:ATP-binding protein [Candidatus Aminicenantes bacterium]
MKIEKRLMKELIREWQTTELPEVLPRTIHIPLSVNKIIAIVGPRRSGKTFLLFWLAKELLSKGVAREKIVYVNFEDPRLLPFEAKSFEVILDSYRELYPELYPELDTAKAYLFLDEIQVVKNWEIGVRRLYDTGKFLIFITGSSSRLLGYEIATQLRGRALTFELFPFSFREILQAKEIEVNELALYSGTRFSILKAFEEYLNYGGFPEVVLTESAELKLRILKSYVETMFLKDLVERYEIRNQAVMRELVKYLATNVSSLFSVSAFFRWIKQAYPITKRTVINYLDYLEDSRLFFLLKRFSFSLKEQALSPRKCYIVDLGLREVFGHRHSQDAGKSLENLVFLGLMQQKAINPLLDVFFWRDSNKKEVDFVVTERGRVMELIQVCAELSGPGVKEREVKPLIAASQKLKCDNLSVVTMDYEDEEVIEKKKIKLVPAWKWLLRDVLRVS